MADKVKRRIEEANVWVKDYGPNLKLSPVTRRQGNVKLLLTAEAYERVFEIVCEIASFNLPAGRPEGDLEGACPGADECENWCYAQSHRYLFEAVDRLRRRNRAALALLLAQGVDVAARALANMTLGWINTIQNSPNTPRAFLLRIHDSGDFFSVAYALSWANAVNIVRDVLSTQMPLIEFRPYAYTKSYGFTEAMQTLRDANIQLTQSLESRWRDRIDWNHPVAATFPKAQPIPIGWVNGNSKELGDLPAVLGEHRIALPHHGVKGASKVRDPLLQIQERSIA